jgi:hypothetical protein
MDQFRLGLPLAAPTPKRARTAAKPILSALMAWLDMARGPISEQDQVWPRLSNYPYGPAPR